MDVDARPGQGANPEAPPEVPGAVLAPELTAYLPYLLRRAHAYVSGHARLTARVRDFAVMAALAEGEAAAQQELAEQLDINRTIMVTLIDRLERHGHVRRTRNPSDRRSYILSLTESGRGSLGAIEETIRAEEQHLTVRLAAEEQQRLNDLLQSILGQPHSGPRSRGTRYLISQAFHQVRRRGDAMVAKHGLRLRDHGPLLGLDRRGPCSQQELARFLAITEPAAVQIVDELVNVGLISRAREPADRRRYVLKLTATGRDRLAELRDAVEQLQSDLVAAVGGPDVERELHALIIKLLPPSPTSTTNAG